MGDLHTMSQWPAPVDTKDLSTYETKLIDVVETTKIVRLMNNEADTCDCG